MVSSEDMFVDPDNPFASPPPKKGLVPNPFGPNAGGVPSPAKPAPKDPSPFEQAIPEESKADLSSLPPKKKTSDSPFGLDQKKEVVPEPEDSDDGFAILDEVPEPVVPVQPAPSKPVRKPEFTLDDDPFALPTPQNRFDSTPVKEKVAELKEVENQEFTPPLESRDSQPAMRSSEKEETAEQPPVKAVPSEDPQMVLRAIFGVTAEMNQEELLDKARSLPGIRHLQVAGPDEAGAMALIRSGVERMGLGNPDSVVITTDSGTLDLIEEPGGSLAVLREGDYGAGVRETLIIVAREVARLSRC